MNQIWYVRLSICCIFDKWNSMFFVGKTMYASIEIYTFMFSQCFSLATIFISFSLMWPSLLYYDSREESYYIVFTSYLHNFACIYEECNVFFLLLHQKNLLWAIIAHYTRYYQNYLHLPFLKLLNLDEDLEHSLHFLLRTCNWD